MHFILIHFRKIQHLRSKITARRNEHQGLSADALLCERFQSFGNLFRLLVVGKGNGGETEELPLLHVHSIKTACHRKEYRFLRTRKEAPCPHEQRFLRKN